MVVVEWGTVIAILVPVAGLVAGVFRVLDGRLTRIDRRAEGRHEDLVRLIRGYPPSVSAHSDPEIGS